MAIKLGITGGIGSGKSVVSHLLEIMGVPVYISDIASKQLTNSDPDIRRQLISLLGENVYIDNQLNKQLLASYLFESNENAGRINRIIHPQVKQDFRKWTIEHSDSHVIALESAILIEAGFVDEIDKLIMVYSPLELRIERVIKRDSTTYEQVLSRIHNQMDDEIKREKADFIILNDGIAPLIPQVKTLLSNLCIRTDY